MTMPGRIAIKVSQLRKRFKAVQALDGVDLDFGAGRIHGIIGPDGAGKTTLLRHLVGLMRADGGEIRYSAGGAAISWDALSPKIAYMPQQQSLYADLSIGEHLDFFRSLYRIPRNLYRSRCEELLEITRLKPFIDRPAGKLSGGMYKKLGLMCALLQSPVALFLDEPTNGVDPISRREFWELLYRMVDTGILILVATAYMDEAERCGEVHLMDAGRCISEGEPAALLELENAKDFSEIFLRREGVRP